MTVEDQRQPGEQPAQDPMADQGPTLPVWVAVDDLDELLEDSKGVFGRSGDAVLRQVPLGPLRNNLTKFVDDLQQVFADVAARGGTLPLKEAQLSFQVTATGGVQLIGTGQVQGTRAITLVFRQ
ncbi:Pepco domain-containing protein [Streptomyces atratus]|uniref:Pepco domain-containing protein n=1 Tax=Streptomyces atratus TaxID=1893 RepID=UPI0033E56829